MRIIQLLPGAGNTFYCENCMRDTALLKVLRQSGHDVLKVPLYLPVMVDDADGHLSAPVFFGGINVYLQQKLGLFRKTPRWIDRLFDAQILLRWASGLTGMTRAKDLADTTISMLRGEGGRQAKELSRLIDWLETEKKPDAVQLSNALLIGMTREIKRRLNVPVVCMLQDEDIFIDPLPEPYRSQVWKTLAERARDVDGFIAVSDFYKTFMMEKLSIPQEKITTVYTGLEMDGYPAKPAPEGHVIGYIERQCPDKGLHILVDAFIILKKRGSVPDLRLRISGGRTAEDRRYVERMKKKIAHAGFITDVEFLPNLTREEKLEFLSSLSVLSVPAPHAEAFGLYIIEALAAGVPVVQPRHGAFPEILGETQGGVLYEPNDPEILSRELETLLLDPKRMGIGQEGKRNVMAKFSIQDTSRQYLSAVEQTMQRYAS